MKNQVLKELYTIALRQNKDNLPDKFLDCLKYIKHLALVITNYDSSSYYVVLTSNILMHYLDKSYELFWARYADCRISKNTLFYDIKKENTPFYSNRPISYLNTKALYKIKIDGV